MYAVCKIARDFKTVTVEKQSIINNQVKHLCWNINLNELAEKDEEVADLLMGKSENHGFQLKQSEALNPNNVFKNVLLTWTIF